MRRPGLEDLVGRHAGRGHARDLAVEREAGHAVELGRVGPHQDPGPARVERREDALPPLDKALRRRGVAAVAAQGLDAARPRRALLRRDVGELGVGPERVERERPVQDFPERHRGDDPGARLARRVDEVGERGLVDRPGGRAERLGIAVDVVERLLALGDRVADPDVGRDVAAEPDADLAGRLGEGVVLGAREAGVDLEQVPPLGRLLADARGGLLGRRDRLVAEAGAGEVERRRQQLARVRAGAELELAGRPEHPADRRDPLRKVEEQGLLGERGRRARRRDVAVHLGQAGSEKPARAVHDRGAVRHLDGPVGPDGDDPVAAHDDGVVGERPLGVGGHDAHVLEDRRVLGGDGRGAGGQREEGEEAHGAGDGEPLASAARRRGAARAAPTRRARRRLAGGGTGSARRAPGRAPAAAGSRARRRP